MCVVLTITLEEWKGNRREKRKEKKRKIIRMPVADPASDNEALNCNSGESDVKD